MEEYPALSDENPYIFNSASERPWNEHAADITSVRFGSAVSPSSMAYWFADTNLSAINWDNCDTSGLTSLRTAFARTKLASVTLPPMPALENLRFAFSEIEPLTSADFSQVGAANITDCNSVFKGSYALETADLSGLAGTVTDSAFMFGNMTATAPNMAVKTIIATEDLDFRSATTSNNMFRSCVDLVGGAGTVYSDSHKDKEYARIDTGETSCPGYFTLPASRTLYDDDYVYTNNRIELPGYVDGTDLLLHFPNGYSCTQRDGTDISYLENVTYIVYASDLVDGFISVPGEYPMSDPEANEGGGLGFILENGKLYMVFKTGENAEYGTATLSAEPLKIMYVEMVKIEPI